MSMEIPLQNIPNQAFSVQIDNNLYDMTIKFIVDVMVVTVVRNGITIMTNVRATPNMPLILYPYLEAEEGNFAFFTIDGDYPNYNQFGQNQFLLYLSPTDLEDLRA